MTTTTLRTTVLALTLAVALAACGSSTSSTDARTGSSPRITGHPTVSSTAATSDRPARDLDRLVDIDGGKLHLRCTGAGPVTVMMLAGWDMGAEAWGPFAGAVSKHTRTCTYDRFGTGTSDAPASTQTFATQADDLRAALTAAGEPGPYLVVGHSFGGPEAVTFASKFAGDVTGIVLVDASPGTWPAVVCSVPAYQAGCDLMRHPDRDAERLDVFPAFDQVSQISSLGDLPLTVITAAHRSSDGISAQEQARLDGLWADGQKRWAELSSSSKVVTVDDTGHDIHLDQPQTVLDEVVGLLP